MMSKSAEEIRVAPYVILGFLLGAEMAIALALISALPLQPIALGLLMAPVWLLGPILWITLLVAATERCGWSGQWVWTSAVTVLVFPYLGQGGAWSMGAVIVMLAICMLIAGLAANRRPSGP